MNLPAFPVAFSMSLLTILLHISLGQQIYQHVQVSGKAPKGAKSKPPAKPAKGASKAKDGSTGQTVDVVAQREQQAGLLATVQSIRSGSAADAAGAEERLKVSIGLIALMTLPDCAQMLNNI